MVYYDEEEGEEMTMRKAAPEEVDAVTVYEMVYMWGVHVPPTPSHNTVTD